MRVCAQECSGSATAGPSRAISEEPRLLKVIGAGFGRTGTTSLTIALERLGFGRCYHFRDMIRRWHVPRWRAILRGERADWDSLFAGYASTADFPAAARYRELAAHYPDAKVVLSTRNPEDWYRSTCATLLPLRRSLPTWLPPFLLIADVTDSLLWRGTFGGRFDDRAAMLTLYEQHVAEVRAAIPPARLLVYDVREGWEPLCCFLGVPTPAEPFPQTNDTAHMRLVIVAIHVAHALLVVGLAALAAWVTRAAFF
jgi:hypothetical protein